MGRVNSRNWWIGLSFLVLFNTMKTNVVFVYVCEYECILGEGWAYDVSFHLPPPLVQLDETSQLGDTGRVLMSSPFDNLTDT